MKPCQQDGTTSGNPLAKCAAVGLLATLVLALLFDGAAQANCTGPDKTPFDLIPKSCKAIAPDKDPTIMQRALSKGTPGSKDTLTSLYTGALITDSQGQTWVKPSSSPEPCASIKLGVKTRLMAYFACCDTGAWGKCVFGGRFLGDLKGDPINVFH